MELRDLEYYLACIDQGSVTAAARHVHAAQPTISHALARLEKQVGERLLERRPRAVLRVTPAGELLAVRARAALAALGAFESDLALLKGRVRGELRIACIQSLNATLLPDVLIAFLKRYPDVRVAARTVAGEDIAQRIAAGHEHVGLVARPEDTPVRQAAFLALGEPCW
jgi:LysR family transcriptional regulator, cyn operon transcriptional activator